MKTSFMMAAAFLLAGSGAAWASHVDYTFADGDGVPYCDGISLDISDGLAVGVHTNGAQCKEGDYAGGLQGKWGGWKGKTYMVTTTDPNLANTVEMYVINQGNMTWSVYDMDTVDNSPFSLVNSGILLKGTPPAHATHALSGRKAKIW